MTPPIPKMNLQSVPSLLMNKKLELVYSLKEESMNGATRDGAIVFKFTFQPESIKFPKPICHLMRTWILLSTRLCVMSLVLLSLIKLNIMGRDFVVFWIASHLIDNLLKID